MGSRKKSGRAHTTDGSGPTAIIPIFNQFRFSYGRTRLNFNEVRERNTSLLQPSASFPNEPFLLNAPFRINNTLPSSPSVLYATSGTTENACVSLDLDANG